MRLLPNARLRCLVATFSMLATTAGAAAGADDAADAVRVLRTLRDPAHPPIEELAVDFERHARWNPDFLCDMLETRLVPDQGDGVQTLSAVQRDLILAAFGRVGRAPTLAAFADRFSNPEELGTRRAMAQVLGAVGTPNDLTRIFEVGIVTDRREADSAMADTIRDATAAILVRDPSGFAVLERTWRTLPSELVPAILLAVGNARDSRGLVFLSEVIRWSGELADVATAQISKLGPSRVEYVNEDLAEQLLFRLDEQPSRCRTICIALAMLRDLGSIPDLITLLGHETVSVQQSALWGLQKLTGLPFPNDARRWTHWYRAEQTWNEHEKAAVLQRVVSGDTRDVERALAEIANHPLARASAIECLPSLIEHRKLEIRVLGCRASADFEATHLVAQLVEHFEDGNPAVAESAWMAAQQLARIDLPPDVALWREALDL